MKIIIFGLCLSFGFGLALVSAVNAKSGLDQARTQLKKTAVAVDPDYRGGSGKTETYRILENIIKTALGFVGTVLMGVIVYGGYMWFFSGGDTEKVKTARQWMTNGVIGTLIVSFAWLLVSFAFQALSRAV